MIFAGVGRGRWQVRRRRGGAGSAVRAMTPLPGKAKGSLASHCPTTHLATGLPKWVGWKVWGNAMNALFSHYQLHWEGRE